MKYEDIKKMIDNIAKDLSKLEVNDKKTFKRKIEANDISGLIDVSLDDPEEIPKENFEKSPLIKDYRYWVLKLDRYYKSKAMKVNQLNVASLKMYASLCHLLEVHLNQSGETLARHVSKLRRQNIHIDLYYTIYLVAESQVINFYNPLSNKSAEKSLNIIEKYLSKDARSLIEKEALDLSKKLKAADKDTRRYFNLTEDGYVSLWWDPDGSFRRKYKFSKKEQLAINQINKRNNVLWKNNKVYHVLMDLFLSTLRGLFDYDESQAARLTRVIKPYKQSKDILNAILIISEENIRQKFIFFTWISSKNQKDLLKQDENIDIYNFIRSYQAKYLDNLDQDLVKDIYRQYLKQNPNKIQDFISYIEMLDIDSKIQEISFFKDQENFAKILEQILKNSYDCESIIALYYLYKLGINKKSHKKYLFNFIDKDNYREFLRIVEDEDLSDEVIDKIIALEKPVPKKIMVDSKKIDLSRENLSKTVNLVNEFFEQGDNDQKDQIEVENKEATNEDKHTNDYSLILTKLLNQGYIYLDNFKNMAKDNDMTVNTYLSKINDSLFDYIGDQTLIIEDDRIVIDEFYVDMIKEYVDGSED